MTTPDFRFAIALLIALATGQVAAHFLKLNNYPTALAIGLAGGGTAFFLIRESDND